MSTQFPGPTKHMVSIATNSKRLNRVETEPHELKLHKDLIVREHNFPISLVIIKSDMAILLFRKYFVYLSQVAL